MALNLNKVEFLIIRDDINCFANVYTTNNGGNLDWKVIMTIHSDKMWSTTYQKNVSRAQSSTRKIGECKCVVNGKEIISYWMGSVSGRTCVLVRNGNTRLLQPICKNNTWQSSLHWSNEMFCVEQDDDEDEHMERNLHEGWNFVDSL